MQDLLYFILLLICASVFWFLLPFFIRKVQTYILKRKCARQRVIVLTFDDGPSETLTPRLVDYFEQNGVCATFFVLGCRAEKKPEIMEKIIQGKHVVGSHSYNHLNAWRSLPLANLKDINQGMKTSSHSGEENKLFRPPYGKTTLLSLLYIFLRRIRVSWWTIDPKDSLENPVSHEIVLAQIRKDNGGVILLHDWDDYPLQDHGEYVMELVEKIITMAKAEGYNFAVVHEV